MNEYQDPELTADSYWINFISNITTVSSAAGVVTVIFSFYQLDIKCHFILLNTCGISFLNFFLIICIYFFSLMSKKEFLEHGSQSRKACSGD